MTPEELKRSWEGTTGFLRDARSHLSEAAERICADEINEFDNYLEHNELELTLDMLEKAFDKSGLEDWRVLELMAMAAASMGLNKRQIRYDDQLSRARGWTYRTVLRR